VSAAVTTASSPTGGWYPRGRAPRGSRLHPAASRSRSLACRSPTTRSHRATPRRSIEGTAVQLGWPSRGAAKPLLGALPSRSSSIARRGRTSSLEVAPFGFSLVWTRGRGHGPRLSAGRPHAVVPHHFQRQAEPFSSGNGMISWVCSHHLW